jgi:TonB family protein
MWNPGGVFSRVAVAWICVLLGGCGHRAAEPTVKREPGGSKAAAPDAVAAELAAKKWKFAAFFHAVTERVHERWNDPQRFGNAGGFTTAPQGASVVLAVTLTRGGRVVDVSVAQPSGTETFDAGVVSAFKAAQPFPAPPPQLSDAQGLVRFRFGFQLDPERADRFKVLRADP